MREDVYKAMIKLLMLAAYPKRGTDEEKIDMFDFSNKVYVLEQKLNFDIRKEAESLWLTPDGIIQIAIWARWRRIEK